MHYDIVGQAGFVVREHRELAEGGNHMSLLTKGDGSAFDADSLSPWFADVIGAPEHFWFTALV